VKAMNEQLRGDELNKLIDNVISGGKPALAGDAKLGALSRLASSLHGLPSPAFKQRLRTELVPDERPIGLVARVGGLPSASWLRGERGIAAAGGGCGLVAGGCCVGGAVIKVVGLASAASIAAFIETSIPYFVGVSIIMMTGMLYWMYRSAGFKQGNLAPAFVRVGVVVGAGYGVVFAATMALSMAMGIY
jgi:hypothetical protein